MRGVELHAARRQFLKGEPVPLAQASQAGTEEMALAQQSGHVKLTL
jgi:hypothetical protein